MYFRWPDRDHHHHMRQNSLLNGVAALRPLVATHRTSCHLQISKDEVSNLKGSVFFVVLPSSSNKTNRFLHFLQGILSVVIKTRTQLLQYLCPLLESHLVLKNRSIFGMTSIGQQYCPILTFDGGIPENCRIRQTRLKAAVCRTTILSES